MSWYVTVSYSWHKGGGNMTNKADKAMGGVGLERTGTGVYSGEFSSQQDAKDALTAVAKHVQEPGAGGTVDFVSVTVSRKPARPEQPKPE